MTINNELQITNINGSTFSTCSNVNNIYMQKGDKNIYEEVIDNLMLIKYSDNIDMINNIKSLPLHKKRLAILLQMDNDHYSWDQLREKINGNRVSKIEHLKDIVKMLRKFIKVAEVERKAHGEIMTPLDELARPMVDLVEKYDESFWKNPNHKVLDSSAGIGTFLIICAAKFMNGLKDIPGFEDPEVRFKHIIENCLYYGELQSRNAFLWLCVVDPHDEYKTNTYFGSFLEKDFDTHMKDVWKVDKFDLIVQNPPYQVQQEGFTKTQPIWQLFVKKSISLLKEDKYMVMVHPSGWRNVDGVFKETQNILKERQILELHIFNEKEGLKMFGAETRFDYYILSNKKYELETNIFCQDGNVEKANLSKMEFIPNGMFTLFKSLLASDEDDKVSIISDSSYHTQRNHLSKTKDNNFKYPCIYTVKSGDFLTMWYSNTNNNGHFGISKLVWSNFRISSAGSFVDENGDYGLTQFSYAIVDEKDKLYNIKTAFDTKEFRNLMEICSVGDMSINRKVIGTFKKDFYKNFL